MVASRLESGDPSLPLYQLRNDRLCLTFLPAVGGRLLSLTVDGRELLWRSERYFDERLRCVRPRSSWPVIDGSFASWANLGGSKSWPAPQGWSSASEWPGPPDAVLDSGAWTWVELPSDDGDLVEMTSGPDPCTGLQLTRRFAVPARGTTFRETIVMRNHAQDPIRWAAWEVCQVDTAPGAGGAGVVSVAVEGTGHPLALGDYHGELQQQRVEGAICYAVQEVVAKRGFADASGTISWTAHDGAGLTLSTEPEPAAEYPDGGARVELWMQAPLSEPIAELSGLHPDAYLAELEILGPLRELAPGETSELAIRWDVDAPAN